jgi:hypothetical protein
MNLPPIKIPEKFNSLDIFSPKGKVIYDKPVEIKQIDGTIIFIYYVVMNNFFGKPLKTLVRKITKLEDPSDKYSSLLLKNFAFYLFMKCNFFPELFGNFY